MINQRRCEYITTIAECKSISKAAQKLFVAQPSLSRYVQKLEEELGVELFDRGKIPLELTEAGSRYLEYIEQFRRLEREMRREFARMSHTGNSQLTVATLPFLGTYILPNIIPPFLERFPWVNLEIKEHNSKSYEKALLNRESDCALTNLPPRHRELDCRVVSADRVLLLEMRTPELERKYDLSQNGMENPLCVDLTLLEEKTFVLLHHWRNMRSVAEEIFRAAGIAPKNILEVPSISAALGLAGCGRGMTFACQSALKYIRPASPLVYYSVGKEVEDIASIVILYRRQHDNTLIDAFCDCAVEQFQASPMG